MYICMYFLLLALLSNYIKGELKRCSLENLFATQEDILHKK